MKGSVYLSIEAFKKVIIEVSSFVFAIIFLAGQAGHSYRKLSPGGDTSAEDMVKLVDMIRRIHLLILIPKAESEGDLGETGEKKHKNDFALWKVKLCIIFLLGFFFFLGGREGGAIVMIIFVLHIFLSFLVVSGFKAG